MSLPFSCTPHVVHPAIVISDGLLSVIVKGVQEILGEDTCRPLSLPLQIAGNAIRSRRGMIYRALVVSWGCE